LLNTNKGNEISHKNIGNELYRIANLTPTIGGNAVLMARAILKYEPKKVSKGIEYFQQTQINNDNVTYYPNPASEYIDIILKNAIFEEGTLIEFFDITGKMVLNTKINNQVSNISIDVRTLKQGLYFCNIKNSNKTAASFKVSIIRNN